MASKRVIAPNSFDRVSGCYFEEIATIGHTPVTLKCEMKNRVKKDKSKTPVVIGEKFNNTIKTHGAAYIARHDTTEEYSPKVTLTYGGDPDLWDSAIDKLCALWSKDMYVLELMTLNRENGHKVRWKRGATENGRRNSRLIIDSVDGVVWSKCNYKKQQSAAGDFWEDTCEFENRTIQTTSPVCKIGSHA